MGEPILRRRADPVPRAELASPLTQRLIDDMVETMRDADGAGIAAPQVYESIRICVIEIAGSSRYPDAPSLPLTVFVNPVVTALIESPESPRDRDTVSLYEGCLSVRGIRGRVRRPRHVRVESLDRDGAPLSLELEGFLASVIQHETDHLDGTLFIDRADTRTLTFLREYDRHVPARARFVDWAQFSEEELEDAARPR
jgi:peptide deformylase